MEPKTTYYIKTYTPDAIGETIVTETNDGIQVKFNKGKFILSLNTEQKTYCIFAMKKIESVDKPNLKALPGGKKAKGPKGQKDT